MRRESALPPTDHQTKRFFALCREADLVDRAKRIEFMHEKVGKDSWKSYTEADARALIAHLLLRLSADQSGAF